MSENKGDMRICISGDAPGFEKYDIAGTTESNQEIFLHARENYPEITKDLFPLGGLLS